MTNYLGFDITKVDHEFILDMQGNIDNQLSFNVESAYYSFMVDPINEVLEVWRYEERIGCFDDLDVLLVSFKINGRSFIELIQDFDFA